MSEIIPQVGADGEDAMSTRLAITPIQTDSMSSSHDEAESDTASSKFTIFFFTYLNCFVESAHAILFQVDGAYTNPTFPVICILRNNLYVIWK